ncbi:hypothetical protein OUZ56_021648 [Daphnia magna]|uniref:Uncharacterized protein n=1 Tax=Daphnia magna TaxID=35525 RepID=A0ABR0AU34_9CRUS|nr:hypothetical protein OUZ56_021648 [Daphnia magna]
MRNAGCFTALLEDYLALEAEARRDHLIAAIFDHNEDKEQGIENSLVSKKVNEFSKKLQNPLALCGLEEKVLLVTLKHLQQSALDKKSNTAPRQRIIAVAKIWIQ